MEEQIIQVKLCPKCGEHQLDEKLLKCERCDTFYVEEDAFDVSLSSRDADVIVRKILKSPRFWIPMVIGTLIAAYGASNFIDWLTGRNLKTYVATLEESSSNKLVEAYGTVTNQIVIEFQTPRITEVVRGVAENQAQAILRKDVTPVVEQLNR